ncbi:hypothetical protein FRZ67_15940 [Panacibacter ginsenosidivorans]|uniref:Lipoprotein n=1 Tax=Panacibacter ginsenosidivorans TaxID=1813871 RepID=A0A5B8VBK8_9BACT|nr:hypothetical protein [Panacibacter ginsenosidivorans]QEC68722.1 hypothetical protein FRZ67_15940 [Panacibacter ginsenosidivorans]
MRMIHLSCFITTIFLILLLSCSSKNAKVVISADRLEGLTTITIDFKDDSTYIIKVSTFLSNEEVKGKYTFHDSLITLTKIPEDGFLNSKTLLLKDEGINKLFLYQLSSDKKIDTTLYEFDCFINK